MMCLLKSVKASVYLSVPKASLVQFYQLECENQKQSVVPLIELLINVKTFHRLIIVAGNSKRSQMDLK